MKLTSSIATIACVTLCYYAASANAVEPKSEPAMQHYSFKYNFNKKVSPVIKRTQEVQQHVRWEVALDLQRSAYNTIQTTYEEVTAAQYAQLNEQANQAHITE